MFGTWAILFPLGVISVRHYKHNDNWLVVHKRLQSTGIFTALLTVMYAVFTSAGAFLTTHHTVGVIMSGGILLQVLTWRGGKGKGGRGGGGVALASVFRGIEHWRN